MYMYVQLLLVMVDKCCQPNIDLSRVPKILAIEFGPDRPKTEFL